jgi:uncharacterized OsmC-like protein
VLAFPHRYAVVATGDIADDVVLASGTLVPIASAPPAAFDGPGDRWSPETLLVGAVAGCFVLTFRGVARAARVSWTSLRCDVNGTLDRTDGKTQFTQFDIQAQLTIRPDTDALQARRALERAESACLVANSLKATTHLTIDIDVVRTPAESVAQ